VSPYLADVVVLHIKVRLVVTLGEEVLLLGGFVALALIRLLQMQLMNVVCGSWGRRRRNGVGVGSRHSSEAKQMSVSRFSVRKLQAVTNKPGARDSPSCHAPSWPAGPGRLACRGRAAPPASCT